MAKTKLNPISHINTQLAQQGCKHVRNEVHQEVRHNIGLQVAGPEVEEGQQQPRRGGDHDPWPPLAVVDQPDDDCREV